jgi:hypothetical protein
VRRFPIGVFLVAATVVLLLPAAAKADPYWFFQGYLPLGDGTRQVFKANVCCDSVNEIRMSWEVNSHPQKFVEIRRSDNGWDGFLTSCYDCRLLYSTTTYIKGGCQNPSPYVATWTNCRVGLFTG